MGIFKINNKIIQMSHRVQTKLVIRYCVNIINNYAKREQRQRQTVVAYYLSTLNIQQSLFSCITASTRKNIIKF
jgi:hypothetical protein